MVYLQPCSWRRDIMVSPFSGSTATTVTLFLSPSTWVGSCWPTMSKLNIFNLQQNTTAEQWQFLTTEQALEDVVYFADRFSLSSARPDTAPNVTSIADNPLHPSNTPWIWLGGSYPGVRGALLRVRNPETIYAVWASSAPVQAEIDMASYYKAAERSLTRNCSADWVAVTRYVDNTLANGTADAAADLKFRLLSAREEGVTREQAANASDVSAAGVLMDPLSFYQVGFERRSGRPLVLTRSCSTTDSKRRSYPSATFWRHETSPSLRWRQGLQRPSESTSQWRPS